MRTPPPWGYAFFFVFTFKICLPHQSVTPFLGGAAPPKKNPGSASVHILHKKNCCDLNLDESPCIFTFFLFSDSGLYQLNGFDFYFDLFRMA